MLARELLDRPAGQGFDQFLEALNQHFDRRLGRSLDRILEQRRRCRATNSKMSRRMDCIDRHLENMRDIHPDTPVILSSPGLGLSWEEDSGPHAVTSLLGQPTVARLHEPSNRPRGRPTSLTCAAKGSVFAYVRDRVGERAGKRRYL